MIRPARTLRWDARPFAYYDRYRRWHRWRDDNQRNWYRKNHNRRYHHFRRDDDRDNRRRDWRNGRRDRWD